MVGLRVPNWSKTRPTMSIAPQNFLRLPSLRTSVIASKRRTVGSTQSKGDPFGVQQLSSLSSRLSSFRGEPVNTHPKLLVGAKKTHSQIGFDFQRWAFILVLMVLGGRRFAQVTVSTES